MSQPSQKKKLDFCPFMRFHELSLTLPLIVVCTMHLSKCWVCRGKRSDKLLLLKVVHYVDNCYLIQSSVWCCDFKSNFFILSIVFLHIASHHTFTEQLQSCFCWKKLDNWFTCLYTCNFYSCCFILHVWNNFAVYNVINSLLPQLVINAVCIIQ